MSKKKSDQTLNRSLMNKTAGLLQWCQKATEGYEGVDVKNFTTSWKDGKAFCALVHHFRPELIEYEKCKNQTQQENLELAFNAADKAGAPRMMDVEDFDMEVPDKLSVITCIGVMQQYLDNITPIEVPVAEPASQKKEYKQYTTYSSVSPTHSPPAKSRSPTITKDQPNAPTQRRSTVASPSDAQRRGPAVMCSACGNPIVGVVALEVKGKKYHKHCFYCARCKNVLDEKSFVSIDDSNYCLACGKEVFFENKKKKVEEEKKNEGEPKIVVQAEDSSQQKDTNVKEQPKPLTRASAGDWREKNEQTTRLQQEKEERERKLKEEKMKKFKTLKPQSPSQESTPQLTQSPAVATKSTQLPTPIQRKSVDVERTTQPTDKGNVTVPKIAFRSSVGKTTILDRKSIENQSPNRNSLTKVSNESPSPSSSPNFIDANDDEWVEGNTIKKRVESPRPFITDAKEEDLISQRATVKIAMPKPVLAMWQFYVGLLVVIGIFVIASFVMLK